MRHPFGESLDFRKALEPVKGSETAAEVADEVLSRVVMIGEILGSIAPCAPETCHIPVSMRQIVRSAANRRRLDGDKLTELV